MTCPADYCCQFDGGLSLLPAGPCCGRCPQLLWSGIHGHSIHVNGLYASDWRGDGTKGSVNEAQGQLAVSRLCTWRGKSFIGLLPPSLVVAVLAEPLKVSLKACCGAHAP